MLTTKLKMATYLRHSIYLLAGLLVSSIPAAATYTASGQFCKIHTNATTLAECIVDYADSEMLISLVGERPNNVKKIQFKLPLQTKPFQTISLSVTPLIDPETVTIMYLDFNFDGYEDFAIMTEISSNENTQYRYFLYDPSTAKFVENKPMRQISNPEILEGSKKIRAYWRQTETLSGWNYWSFSQNTPILIKRIEQRRKGQFSCSQTTIIYTKPPTQTKSTTCQ